jgi:hypothetical protein
MSAVGGWQHEQQQYSLNAAADGLLLFGLGRRGVTFVVISARVRTAVLSLKHVGEQLVQPWLSSAFSLASCINCCMEPCAGGSKTAIV